MMKSLVPTLAVVREIATKPRKSWYWELALAPVVSEIEELWNPVPVAGGSGTLEPQFCITERAIRSRHRSILKCPGPSMSTWSEVPDNRCSHVHLHRKRSSDHSGSKSVPIGNALADLDSR